MPSLVLRLVVLWLAFVFQAGSWRSAEGSPACSGGARAAAAPFDDGAKGCDAPEDSEELFASDDSFGSDGVPAGAAMNWGSPAPSGHGYAWVDGLAPGRPPGEAPFRPPRA
jgi:hypothetical protein